ncbi:hypothetical protein ACFQ34_26145 [Pseudonocardia benzenivorans]|uniref:Uncharacterized protein n=2 Tax=Pseudonocardia TaxID=1847 RepID=F4D083_PSEUX|nr:hypothetical protein [Pseudonocardia dioxanivorans]AEA25739.1 hypothetical protein Psed_3567 [Pseudonocardia dioxanivorans CB1190]GJF04206.1 hypothetical protein PSD17_31640 [Pseudonocardia sp. D17]
MDATSTRHGACLTCARPRTLDDVHSLEWSSEHAPDGTIGFRCGPCTREQLWRIEALLAPEPVAAAPVAA